MTEVGPKKPAKKCEHRTEITVGQNRDGWVSWCPNCGAIKRAKPSGAEYWTPPAVSR